MHLLRGQPRSLTAEAEPVDLEQSSGDIVILTAADTEISGLAAARRALGEPFPSVRLANWMQLLHPYSVDLYGERVLAHAKLIAVRLLGGASYWRYGLDETVRIARGNSAKLVVLPGDATWDAALAAHGTASLEEAQKLWSYLVEGGSENLANALRYCAHRIGACDEPGEATPLPTAGIYAPAWKAMREPSPPEGEGGRRLACRSLGEGGSRPGEGESFDLASAASRRTPPHPSASRTPSPSRGEGRHAQTAAIVFYRALVQAGQTEPVDALAAALSKRGLAPMAIYVSGLKAKEDAAFVAAALAELRPAVVLNATAFALSEPGREFAGTVLDQGDRPVLQVTFAGVSEEAWAGSTRGLAPTDLTMNVVLPEIDGRIVTRAVSFKEAGELDALTECRPVHYRPKPDRVEFVAELAARWARLRATPNAQKRVAIVLSNYPNRDGRIGNGVGLDVPASTANVLKAMQAAEYDAAGAPDTGAALMALLLAGPTNAQPVSPPPRGEGLGEGSHRLSSRLTPHTQALSPQGGEGLRSGAALSLESYRACFDRLPAAVRAAVTSRWGSPESDPFVMGKAFILPAHRFGNVVIGIQAARGYNIDPKSSYHDPDLVPPHGYFAFYFWLRETFGADAIVQMGKHGNLEWLPGKALALSESCYPEAALGPLPVVYPFIVNDPGEGAQAKRRTAAVVVDHLMPAMARAETYGPAAELEALIDEYAAAESGDPRRARFVAEKIADLAQAHGFDRDLGLDLKGDRQRALAKLDEHICDLKELQIRDGLHVLGEGPTGRQRAETLVALARVPRGEGRAGDASLLRALADDLQLGFDPLGCDFAAPWDGPRPHALVAGPKDQWRTCGDTVERLEALALRLVEERLPSPPCGERVAGPKDRLGEGCFSESLCEDNPSPSRFAAIPSPQGGGGSPPSSSEPVLEGLAAEIGPSLDLSGSREISATLAALSGKFVPPGPSGAPTRGRADCLPTGRNFYSVDVRAVPTPAAWDLGRRSADLLAERYFQDEGEWPRAIALTVWGTSNMRTGGDDIAQALALIGARPVWEGASGRVTGVEVIPLAELKRPRVDVTLRISGFFRDAFPSQIALFHQAVQAVAEEAEPEDANPIAARIRADAKRLAEAGLASDEARRAASFRVFGSKPGAYGAGLQALIDEGIWAERKDLAAAFLEWSAFAYGGGAEGSSARGLLEARLKATDAVVQNQDNREHDLLDSDDYYQFEGGLAASVETLKGEAPRVFHNDHSRPERPVIRALEEEVARVVRGRAANPKWIAGVMRHGYKGAFEIAATVDYLFAFAATTNAVRHHHFEQLYDAYLGDEAVRGFIAENNPPALKEIAARFCEAVDRGLWAPRRNSAYEELRALARAA
ncbi:MAG: cobaltochelatase subunit CobN [Propylenella sp.]